MPALPAPRIAGYLPAVCDSRRAMGRRRMLHGLKRLYSRWVGEGRPSR